MNVIASSIIDKRWFNFRKMFEPGMLTSTLDMPEGPVVFRDDFQPKALIPILENEEIESVTVIYSAPENLISERLLSKKSITDGFIEDLRHSYHELYKIKSYFSESLNLILIDDLLDGKKSLPVTFNRPTLNKRTKEKELDFVISEIVRTSISFLNSFDFFIRKNFERYNKPANVEQCLQSVIANKDRNLDACLQEIEKYIADEYSILNNTLKKDDSANIKSLQDRIFQLAKNESKNKEKLDWLRRERIRHVASIEGFEKQNGKLFVNLIASEVKMARIQYSSNYFNRLLRLTKSKRSNETDYQRCLLQNSSLFDAQWYLYNYPDVKASGISPELHFLKFGAKENRDPSKYFIVKRYLSDNPDVKKSNVNPLIHFLLFGCFEGRTITGNKLC